MKRFVVAVTVALAALALAAPASATTVVITITCEQATFAYSSFPEGRTSTSVETVTVDGTTVYSVPFEFIGPTATHTVPLSIVGNATVVATSAWTTPFNQGSESTPPTPVECGGGTTDGTTQGTTDGTTEGTTEGTDGTTEGTTEGTDGTTNGTGQHRRRGRGHDRRYRAERRPPVHGAPDLGTDPPGRGSPRERRAPSAPQAQRRLVAGN